MMLYIIYFVCGVIAAFLVKKADDKEDFLDDDTYIRAFQYFITVIGGWYSLVLILIAYYT